MYYRQVNRSCAERSYRVSMQTNQNDADAHSFSSVATGHSRGHGRYRNVEPSARKHSSFPRRRVFKGVGGRIPVVDEEASRIQGNATKNSQGNVSSAVSSRRSALVGDESRNRRQGRHNSRCESATSSQRDDIHAAADAGDGMGFVRSGGRIASAGDPSRRFVESRLSRRNQAGHEQLSGRPASTESVQEEKKQARASNLFAGLRRRRAYEGNRTASG